MEEFYIWKLKAVVMMFICWHLFFLHEAVIVKPLRHLFYRPLYTQHPTLAWYTVGAQYNTAGANQGASLVTQTVKSLPAGWETQVRPLGQEDTLEKEMMTHSRILTWKNPMGRGAWWATVHGVAKSQTRLSHLTFFLFLSSALDTSLVYSRCSKHKNDEISEN